MTRYIPRRSGKKTPSAQAKPPRPKVPSAAFLWGNVPDEVRVLFDGLNKEFDFHLLIAGLKAVRDLGIDITGSAERFLAEFTEDGSLAHEVWEMAFDRQHHFDHGPGRAGLTKALVTHVYAPWVMGEAYDDLKQIPLYPPPTSRSNR